MAMRFKSSLLLYFALLTIYLVSGLWKKKAMENVSDWCLSRAKSALAAVCANRKQRSSELPGAPGPFTASLRLCEWNQASVVERLWIENPFLKNCNDNCRLWSSQWVADDWTKCPVSSLYLCAGGPSPRVQWLFCRSLGGETQGLSQLTGLFFPLFLTGGGKLSFLSTRHWISSKNTLAY